MPDPAPAKPEVVQQDQRLWRGFGRFIEQISPALFDVGAWIFGGLLAFDLLILASLFTIGPVAASVRIATAALAFALPLDLLGLILIRLTRELKGAGYEDRFLQALQDEGYSSTELPAPDARQGLLAEMHRQRSILVLQASAAFLVISMLLVLIGLSATLWYMAWWIAVGFLVMLVVCAVSALIIVSAPQPQGPPAR